MPTFPALPPPPSATKAVELDDLQRDASDVFGLRQQLSSAQQAEAQLRKEVQQLRQQLGSATASAAGTSSRGEGSEDLSPRSSRSIGSAASPPRTVGRQGTAALQGRLDSLARELAAAKQEVGLLELACWRACVRMAHVFLLKLSCNGMSLSSGLAHSDPNNLASPPACLPQISRLAGDRDRLRDELDSRDTEVMQLQGQLALLQAQVADASDNWRWPLPDPL